MFMAVADFARRSLLLVANSLPLALRAVGRHPRRIVVAAAVTVGAACIGSGAAVVLCDDDQTPAKETWKERIKGAYENKLRAFSHPFKVFNYFASKKIGDERFMTPTDLIDSIVPYHPLMRHHKKQSKVRSKAAQKLMLADTDGDNLISFSEYMFFMILLSTTESDFHVAFKIFDEDGNGKVDEREFRKIMHLQENLVEISKQQGYQERQLPSRNIEIKKNSGLMKLLFGEDGRSAISFDHFRQFLQDLNRSVLTLEFYQLSVDDDDTISARDFGASLIAYTNGNEIPAERLDSISSAVKERITLKEYLEFFNALSKLSDISYALQFYEAAHNRQADKEYVARAFKSATEWTIPESQLSVLFQLFGNDGLFDASKFGDVGFSRISRNLNKSRSIGLSKFWERVQDCSRILVPS